MYEKLYHSLPKYKSIFFLLLTYSLMILRSGYEFGRSDQNEMMPYVLMLGNTNLFSADLFLSTIIKIVPNERWIFVHLLALGAKHLELWAFCLHFICAISLLSGMEKIARLYLKNFYLVWLSIIITLIVLYDKNLGGNELYYHYLLPGGMSKAVGIWGLYAFLKEKYFKSLIFFFFATLFHPLSGFQPGLVVIAVLWISTLREYTRFRQGNTPINFSKNILYTLFYFLTAGLWLILLKFALDHSATGGNPQDLFNIIFRFRTPHHHTPFSYPLWAYTLLSLLIWAAFSYSVKYKYDNLAFFLAITFVGGIIYIIGVELLESPLIGSFQWFKMTVWVKFLGIVCSLAAVETFLLQMGGIYATLFKSPVPFFIDLVGTSILIFFSWVVILFVPEILPWKVHYDLLGKQYKSDLVIDICLKAKQLTDEKAVFVHPLQMTELQYYGERSCYVDWKAFPRHPFWVKKWGERIEEVYGLSYEYPPQNKIAYADTFYKNLNMKRLSELSQKGVTHFITFAGIKVEGMELLAKNKEYQLYKINATFASVPKNPSE